jgi:tetratricopeptide (TPR) repeat protein
MKRTALEKNQSVQKKQKTTASNAPESNQLNNRQISNPPSLPQAAPFPRIPPGFLQASPLLPLHPGIPTNNNNFALPNYTQSSLAGSNAHSLLATNPIHPMLCVRKGSRIVGTEIVPPAEIEFPKVDKGYYRETIQNIYVKNYPQAWRSARSFFELRKHHSPMDLHPGELILRDTISQCQKTNAPEQYLQSSKLSHLPPFLEMLSLEENKELRPSQDLLTKINNTMQENPNFIYAYFLRGLAYHHLKDEGRALADFESSIQIYPNSAPTYYLLALLNYKSSGERLSYINKYIELDPTYIPAYFLRASLNSSLGNYYAAINDTYGITGLENNSLLEKNSLYHNLVAFRLRASLFLKLQEYLPALIPYQEIINANPPANKSLISSSHYAMGKIYEKQGNDAQASEHFNKAYNMNQALFSLQELVSFCILKNHGKVYTGFGLSFFKKNNIEPDKLREILVKSNITTDSIHQAYQSKKQTCQKTLIDKLDDYDALLYPKESTTEQHEPISLRDVAPRNQAVGRVAVSEERNLNTRDQEEIEFMPFIPIIKEDPNPTSNPTDSREPPLTIAQVADELGRCANLVSRKCNKLSSSNCVPISFALIDFLKSGIMPKKALPDKKSSKDNIEFFHIFQKMLVPIKQESAENLVIDIVTSSCVNRNTIFGSYAPLGSIPHEENGQIDLTRPYVNTVDTYQQKSVSYTVLNKTLKQLASSNNSRISFGIVNVKRCGVFVEWLEHLFVYYATPEKVIYVDGLRVSGDPVFYKITEVFQFAGASKSKEINSKIFGNLVYYIPIGSQPLQLQPESKGAELTEEDSEEVGLGSELRNFVC